MRMNWNRFLTAKGLFSCLLLLSSLFSMQTQAQQNVALQGKNGWLFYVIDFTESSDQPSIDISTDLIARMSNLLSENGTQLLVTLVPIKSRVYEEFLPEQRKISPFLAANYQKIFSRLQQGGVKVVDLESAFRQQLGQHKEFPLFLRTDSHWSQPGTFLAAQTIKARIEADSTLSAALSKSVAQTFQLTWGAQPMSMQPGDLAQTLPAGQRPGNELVKFFSVKGGQDDNALLTSSSPGIFLLGSSYSGKWTGFPDALKSALQRDLPFVSVPANRGQWYALHEYFADAGFQKQPPALMIFEVPERALVAPPAYPYREARYNMKDTDWLRKVGSLIDRKCVDSLPAGSAHWHSAGKGRQLLEGASLNISDVRKDDFMELKANPEVLESHYLKWPVTSGGTGQIRIEFYAAGQMKQQTRHVLDEEGETTIKIASPSGEKVDLIRLYPSATKMLSARQPVFCRLPESARAVR